MTLRKLQSEFAILSSGIPAKARELGYEVTNGDAYRDPRVFGNLGESKGYGHPKSAHKLRLARDFNLFKDGKYRDDTESHRALGEWWEKQHPLARWGGRFRVPDGNHYSFEYEGVM